MIKALGDLIMTIGYIAVPIGISYAIISYTVKWIIQSHGFKVTYMITQYSYENKILKSLEHKNGFYRLIRRIYFIVNIVFISLIGLIVSLFICMIIFR